MRSLVLIILLGITMPVTGWSQAETSRVWGPRASPLFTGTPQALSLMLADTVTRQPQPTHWKEGAITGGVLLGLLGAVAGAGLCSYSETTGSCTGATVLGLVGGGAVGFVLGALIGGQFPKGTSPPPSPPDSTQANQQ